MYGIWNGTQVIARFVVPISLQSNHPIFFADSLSLKRYSERRSAQRWELTTKLEPLYMEAGELQTHLIINGYGLSFTITTPQNVGVALRRTTTANPIVAATGAALSNVTVNTNNGLIPTGTFIKFSNHDKVYMVGADRNGPGVMAIYPPLRVALPLSTTFTFREDVLMKVKYDTDTVIGMNYDDGILMDVGQVKFIEAV